MKKTKKTFSEWLSIYERVKHQEELRRLVFKKMAETATTFDELNFIYWRVTSGREKKHALDKMAELATTCRDWSVIHQRALRDSDLGKLALDKMVELAELAATCYDWDIVYSSAPHGSDTKEYAFNKITELATTFKEWSKMGDRFSPGSGKLRKLSFEKMIEKATTCDEWLTVHHRASEGSEPSRLAARKIIELATTPYELSRAYLLVPYASKQRERIQKEMFEQDATLDEWAIVFRTVPRKLKPLVLEKIAKIDAPLEKWLNIHQSLSNASVDEIIIKKTVEPAATIDELLNIYRMATRDGRLEAAVLKKIAKIDMSFDEWLDLYNIPTHLIVPSNLQKLALRKMAKF